MRVDRGRLRALLPLWLLAAIVGWLLYALGNAKPFLDDALRALEVVGAAALLWASIRALRRRGTRDRRHGDRRQGARRDAEHERTE